MKEKRFVEVYSYGMSNAAKIFVDKQTGVNYLLLGAPGSILLGCGVTVLVGADGKPIVTPVK